MTKELPMKKNRKLPMRRTLCLPMELDSQLRKLEEREIDVPEILRIAIAEYLLRNELMD